MQNGLASDIHRMSYLSWTAASISMHLLHTAVGTWVYLRVRFSIRIPLFPFLSFVPIHSCYFLLSVSKFQVPHLQGNVLDLARFHQKLSRYIFELMIHFQLFESSVLKCVHCTVSRFQIRNPEPFLLVWLRMSLLFPRLRDCSSDKYISHGVYFFWHEIVI